MTALNRIRRYHPAFARLRSTRMWPTTNPSIFAFSKESDDGTDRVLVIVNLDPTNVQEAIVHLDQTLLGLPLGRPYLVHDELSNDTYEWNGPDPYVRLDPTYRVAHILSLNMAAG